MSIVANDTSNITMTQFEEIIAEAYAVDKEIEDFKRDVLKPKQDRLELLENKILEILASHDMSSYKSKSGTVVRSLRYSVRTPKTTDEKIAFFDYLRKEKGEDVLWAYTTVNSASLNAFYKAEMAAAKEVGDFDFKIPGIGEPEASPILSRRKA